MASEALRVELRAGRIPGLPGLIADHHWLLVIHATNSGTIKICDRWEIWQHANRNNSCWGHLHKNLLSPFQGVGNGPSRLIHHWVNDDANLIINKIETSPLNYPFLGHYGYWPGPNSNTYAQWIVCEKMRLGHRAIGKDFKHPLITASYWMIGPINCSKDMTLKYT